MMKLPQQTTVIDTDYYHALHDAAQTILSTMRSTTYRAGANVVSVADSLIVFAYIERLEMIAGKVAFIAGPEYRYSWLVDRGDVSLARIMLGHDPLPLPPESAVALEDGEDETR